MGDSLHYLDEVENDVREAKIWYKNQKDGLEKRFAREVKKCINRPYKSPLSYKIRYRNVRTALTAVFPYAIHFYIDETKEKIIIIAVINQNRNPVLPFKRSSEI